MSDTPPRCRHCGKPGPHTRPRSLCWTCYYTPGVRDRYPSTSKFARRALPDKCGPVPQPAEPTTALPGSRAKLAELERRAQRREDLWHPADAGVPD